MTSVNLLLPFLKPLMPRLNNIDNGMQEEIDNYLGVLLPRELCGLAVKCPFG